MHRGWWLGLLVGCYRPAAYDECNVRCGNDVARTCPSGLTCDGNDLCKPAGMQGDCPPREAGIVGDADFEDAGLDGPPNGLICFGEAGDFFRVCVVPPINDETISATMIIDTSACVQNQVQSAPPAVCVLAFRNLTITASGVVRVVGPRPLAIVVTGTLQIDGTLDAASHQGEGVVGGGANEDDCITPVAGSLAATQTTGAGGGAGGSLVGAGGEGGGGSGGAPGGMGTPSIEAAKLLRVRGGCHGARGGSASGGVAGAAGDGGGAIYLMSKTGIAIGANGRVNASGGGGYAPGPRGGGGGGGSGGFIGFHAPMYMFSPSAQIYAVGGAGASGGGATVPGKPGFEAIEAANTEPTQAPSGAGAGGYGAVGGGQGGSAGTISAGGGGGGGGGGLIGFEGQSASSGIFAPPPRGL